jgi:hypothetical protein
MSNLMTIETRVSVLLHDTTQLNFSAALVDEAIRLALADYSRVSGLAETITGLDGAAASGRSLSPRNMRY